MTRLITLSWRNFHPSAAAGLPNADTIGSTLAMTAFRVAIASIRAQAQMTRRDVEDLYPIITIPLTSVVSIAVLQQSGRDDLVGYALVAVVLMSVGQMALFVGSEILANERQGQTLELIVASPTDYVVPLLARVTVLSLVGIVGFVEAWLIAWLGFDAPVRIYHPVLAVVTLVLTAFASATTALITSAIFSFGRTVRTYQNALAGPLYLLGGVLVPTTFLPEFVQPLCRVIYLYWSADLLRDALQPTTPALVGFRLAAIVGLGLAGGAIGAWLIGRLLSHLRREGTVGL
jgi:ABC-2 type transport system permease protein